VMETRRSEKPPGPILRLQRRRIAPLLDVPLRAPIFVVLLALQRANPAYRKPWNFRAATRRGL